MKSIYVNQGLPNDFERIFSAPHLVTETDPPEVTKVWHYKDDSPQVEVLIIIWATCQNQILPTNLFREANFIWYNKLTLK